MEREIRGGKWVNREEEKEERVHKEGEGER